MEVEYEYQRPAAIDKLARVFVQCELLDEPVGQYVERCVEILHRAVELVQSLVSEKSVVGQ